MNPPCSVCLKYPICLTKLTVKCKDLTNYLLCDNIDTGLRIQQFETHKWNKDVSVISKEGVVCFKSKRDMYSAFIIP